MKVINKTEETLSERHLNLGNKTDSKQHGLKRTKEKTSEPNITKLLKNW